MVLGLLKWLKETRFYKSKKKIITKHALCIQRRTLVERRNLHVLRNEKVMFQSLKEKKNERIFSLAWNTVCWLQKSSCFEFFGDGKYGLF